MGPPSGAAPDAAAPRDSPTAQPSGGATPDVRHVAEPTGGAASHASPSAQPSGRAPPWCSPRNLKTGTEPSQTSSSARKNSSTKPRRLDDETYVPEADADVDEVYGGAGVPEKVVNKKWVRFVSDCARKDPAITGNSNTTRATKKPQSSKTFDESDEGPSGRFQ